MGDKRKTPVKYLKGIDQCSSKKVTQLTACLRSLYTNTLSIGNKKEFEATRVLERYNLLAITENWWDESMTGLWLLMATDFSEGQRGREFALYIKVWRDCEELRKNSRELLKVC